MVNLFIYFSFHIFLLEARVYVCPQYHVLVLLQYSVKNSLPEMHLKRYISMHFLEILNGTAYKKQIILAMSIPIWNNLSPNHKKTTEKIVL